MFRKIFETAASPPGKHPREGDLYKKVTTFGQTFELRYGYYDEKDRKWGEPVVLYPDFRKVPIYTQEGVPFVTMVQDACEYYTGRHPKAEDCVCADCQHFACGEEWFGICNCSENRRI